MHKLYIKLLTGSWKRQIGLVVEYIASSPNGHCMQMRCCMYHIDCTDCRSSTESKLHTDWTCVDGLKPGFHLNANRTRTHRRHAKTKQIFDADMLPRGSKQYSLVRRTFSKQPNTIHRLSVLQREVVYNTFRCRVYSLLQWTPNSLQNMYCTFYLDSLPHVLFAFTFSHKPGLRQKAGKTI